MEKIEITIVDKQTFLRNGLYRALEVLKCDPANLITVLQDRSPDVIILDIDYPSLTGLELCRKIVRRLPSISVVVVTPKPTDRQLVEAVKSGAAAYLSKSATVEELARTIKQVCLGEYPINETFAAMPRDTRQAYCQFGNMVSTESAAPNADARLSPRELEILEYLAAGARNKEIAYILHISEQTAKNHVSSILRKMSARDRAHATALAIRSGWVVHRDLSGLPQREGIIA
jgi:DNA-binding NarL/FixJ family response regulator